MIIAKHYSHKGGYEALQRERQHVLDEIASVIASVSPADCLSKETKEKGKIKKWGGLVFSPRVINDRFRKLLYPLGWAQWDERNQRYIEPTLTFANQSAVKGNARFRRMDGVKDRVGLEVQMGKYAFMGYDIFSKMIIFRNKGVIDCGIEIVPTQEMVDCMSTGVSAFEHLMIDFAHRGEADIDIPVLVYGIAPTAAEWDTVRTMQQAFKTDPIQARMLYPTLGLADLRGNKPGPK